MNPTDTKTLQEKFAVLPDKIKQWLSSEELVYIISDIEMRLGLDDEKVLIIPSIVLRLAVQDIEPQDFTNTLAQELGVSSSIAKTIAEDIEKNALRPIEGELRSKTGIETKLIYHPRATEKEGAPKPSTAAPKETPAPLPQVPSRPIPAGAPQSKPTTPVTPSPRPISPLTFTATAQKEVRLPEPPKVSSPVPPVAPAASAMPAPAPKPQPIPRPTPVAEPEPAAPFVLHQEGSATVAPTLSPQPRVTSAPRTSLTMKVQNYYQSMGTAERPIAKPVSVQMETPPMTPEKPAAPAAPIINQAPQPEQARVVHYSPFRTPITSEGSLKKEQRTPDQNVVDLRKFM